MRVILGVSIVIGMLGGPALAEDADTSLSASPDSDIHLVGDLRFMSLSRDDNNFISQAKHWGYDIPGAAGIEGRIGAQLLPRLTVSGEGFYVGDGADRGLSKLRINSGALLAVVQYALLHHAEQDKQGPLVLGDVSLVGGGGDYFIHETFVDPELSPMVYSKRSSSYGGFGGVEAAMTVSALRIVFAYSYHVASAAIDDRIRGSVDAGGHEVSFGLGVRL